MAKTNSNILCAECPSREVLELLADKWALLAVFRLCVKPHRTSELRREIEGVSEKMLIHALRKLERYGLVSRQDFGQIPPRVEYELTVLGKSLAVPVQQLEQWVTQNLKSVVKAKQRFDAQRS